MITKERIEMAIEEAKVYLRLQHWTVEVDWESDCDDLNAIASVLPVTGRYIATVNFSSNILEREEEEVTMAITHELLHLHSFDIYDTMTTLVRSCSADTQDAIKSMLRLQIEKMTDALAISISDIIGVYESFTYEEEEEVTEEEPKEEPKQVTGIYMEGV